MKNRFVIPLLGISQKLGGIFSDVFEGAYVDMWGAVGGNKLLIFILVSFLWCVVCIPIKKILGKRFTGILASVGVLVILYYWAKLFLN